MKKSAPAEVPAEVKADWAKIRRDYENAKKPLTETAAKAGMTWQKLVSIARGAGWKPRTPPELPMRPSNELGGSSLAPSRLATRLKRLIAREIESIEGEIAHERDAVEKERDARRLSTLVRSLEKLNDIKAAKAKREPKSGDGADDGDAMRAELERRLARLAAGDGANGISGQPDTAGDALAS
ncbi:MAG TPA: hypothetical protein VF449_00180 [Parvibaculum sp.]